MDNYIVINGRKAELTDEQLKQLGINVEKENPFGRKIGEAYFYIQANGTTIHETDGNTSFDRVMYNQANYFKNREIAQQVALQQLLYRKLLKYAYENDAIVTDWTDLNSQKYFISKSMNKDEFYVDWNHMVKHGCEVYFTDKKVAQKAIEDVILPFMKEHPEFVW